jgi:transcriptional regulator with XRE-family HTH domain
MLKTTGGRLHYVRKQLGLNQSQLAELFGLKGNSAVSYMESRDTALPKEYLKIMEEKYMVSPMYLQMGEGPMFLPGAKVEEPEVTYTARKKDFSLVGVRARFQEQVNDYQRKHGVEYRKEIAKLWDLNVSHLNGVMNDLKDINIGMLLKAHMHGKLNLNYTASGEGGFYVGDESSSLLKRIRELEDVVAIFKESIALREGVPKKRHSG